MHILCIFVSNTSKFFGYFFVIAEQEEKTEKKLKVIFNHIFHEKNYNRKQLDRKRQQKAIEKFCGGWSDYK